MGRVLKIKLKTVTPPEISVDLEQIALIELHGQRDSSSGSITAVLTLRSGAIISALMLPEDYDKLLLDWNPPVTP